MLSFQLRRLPFQLRLQFCFSGRPLLLGGPGNVHGRDVLRPELYLGRAGGQVRQICRRLNGGRENNGDILECHEVKPYSLVWLDVEVTRASDTMALSHNLWERKPPNASVLSS